MEMPLKPSERDEEHAKRVAALAPDGKALWLAYDHGLEHGQTDFNAYSIDATRVVRELSPFFDGVILNIGVARLTRNALKAPLILKATGRSNLAPTQIQAQTAFVDEALALRAAAVAATIYVGESYEHEMMAQLALLREEAHAAGLPLVGFMYPRGPRIVNPHAPEVVAYAARIGLELGCDFVKTYWTGSGESFKRVVDAARGARIVVAGGPLVGARAALDAAAQAVESGAVGVAVGRNVWLHDKPQKMTQALKAIVHRGLGVDEALAQI